jgi:glycopeptide antibiotics resistance protein
LNGSRLILTSRHFFWITLAFMAFVIYGSLVPLTYRPVPLGEAFERYTSALSKPVVVKDRADWLANILLFIPLGFVAMGWRCVDRHRTDPLAMALVLISCTMLSAGIEFAQIFFPPRDTSLNDIVAETLGGAIGILGWLAAGQHATDYLRKLWTSQGEANWAIRLIPGYLVLLVFVQGIPFDLTLSPHLLKKKYYEGRILLVPFKSPGLEPLAVIRKMLINIAYFLPAGILLSGLSRKLIGGRWAAIRVLLIGIVLAGSIEFMQLLVMSRFFDSTDIVTGSLAVVAGWGLMRLCRAAPNASVREAGIPSSVRGTLFLAWTAALVFINWVPFNFTFDQWQLRLREFNWVPFADYYAGNYLNSFDQIVQKTALFIPFGLLWPSVSSSRFDVHFGVGSALLLATIIEIGQAFLPDHHPGVSDLLIETFGAWIGCIAAKRLRVSTTGQAVAEVYQNRALAT